MICDLISCNNIFTVECIFTSPPPTISEEFSPGKKIQEKKEEKGKKEKKLGEGNSGQ